MKATLRKTEARELLLFTLFIALVFAMLWVDRRADVLKLATVTPAPIQVASAVIPPPQGP